MRVEVECGSIGLLLGDGRVSSEGSWVNVVDLSCTCLASVVCSVRVLRASGI